MSQKLVIIWTLIWILLSSLKLSEQLFSEPDLEKTIIDEKWRDWCGFRYIPKKISYPKNCYGNQFKTRIYVDPLLKKGSPSNRIFGGRNVRPHESPWTVQITKRKKGDEDEQRGTGVFLTMRHILTVAHLHRTLSNTMRLWAGSDNTSSTNWRAGPGEFTFLLHPNRSEPGHDIMIIRLNEPINWGSHGRHQFEDKSLLINTICLPKPEKSDIIDSKGVVKNFGYQKATFFGWGQKSGKSPTYHLKRGDTTVAYNDKNTDLFISEDFDVKACPGDSGAGLVQYLDENEDRAVLIGLLRTAEQLTDKCDDEHIGDYYFVRIVSNLDWIYQTLEENP